jgi:hypothetical protein
LTQNVFTVFSCSGRVAYASVLGMARTKSAVWGYR